MRFFQRRFRVRVTDTHGSLVSQSLPLPRRRAEAFARWVHKASIGGHKWQAPVPTDQQPVWNIEVIEDGS